MKWSGGKDRQQTECGGFCQGKEARDLAIRFIFIDDVEGSRGLRIIDMDIMMTN